MNFRLAPSAITDIEAILQHLMVESPTGAIAVAARFDEVFRGIEDFPGFGKRTDRKGIRWTNTHPYPYLIFYKTSPSLTEIVAVRHGARNPRSMPARPR
jgi:plasmid stabilization system protein ParE